MRRTRRLARPARARRGDRSPRWPARRRADPLRREAVPEHARGPQDALGTGPLGVEARLDGPQHRVGEGISSARGDGPDELLEVEGVAVGALDDPPYGAGVDALAERLA